MLTALAIVALACPPWCRAAPEIPCACECLDIDGDGLVEIDDVYALAALVAASDPRGDFNADGHTDPDDIADFIAAFFDCIG